MIWTNPRLSATPPHRAAQAVLRLSAATTFPTKSKRLYTTKTAFSDGLQQRDSGLNGGLGFDPENINPEDIVSTIYFGFNQYAIAGSERENVKKAAEFFKANPNMKVYLVGHTDWYGTEEYNMLLSDKRCKSVQEYMLGLGVNGDKLETVARGEQGAVVDVAKDSPEAKHDRRVDIVKVK